MLYGLSKEAKTRLLRCDSQKPSYVTMIVSFVARLKNYVLRNRSALTWLLTNADIADFFAHKININICIPAYINVNDKDEIRSDLSASIQVVSGECICSCNDVLQPFINLKYIKANGGK